MLKLISFSIVLLLLSGCTNKQIKKDSTSKCSVEYIEKNLSNEDKKRLYKNIRNEIQYLLDDADTFYAKTYYLKALQNYKLINFYNETSHIPQEKIRFLETRVAANGKYYYDKAKKTFNKDKLQTLFYLNELMRNDPEYKDGKELYLQLRQDGEIVKLLSNDKKKLQNLMEITLNSEKDILELSNAIDRVARYDDFDPFVIEGKRILKLKRYQLHTNAIELYKNNKIHQAKKKFEFIQKVYLKDKLSRDYLSMIEKKDKVKAMEQEAVLALKSGDYKKAMDIANDILGFNDHNTQALSILEKANIELKQQIPTIIKKATQLYSQQNYQEALILFQDVLKLEATNNTALIYTKKIKAQLKTIKSLQ